MPRGQATRSLRGIEMGALRVGALRFVPATSLVACSVLSRVGVQGWIEGRYR
jgi:hypothetical protein